MKSKQHLALVTNDESVAQFVEEYCPDTVECQRYTDLNELLKNILRYHVNGIIHVTDQKCTLETELRNRLSQIKKVEFAQDYIFPVIWHVPLNKKDSLVSHLSLVSTGSLFVWGNHNTLYTLEEAIRFFIPIMHIPYASATVAIVDADLAVMKTFRHIFHAWGHMSITQSLYLPDLSAEDAARRTGRNAHVVLIDNVLAQNAALFEALHTLHPKASFITTHEGTASEADKTTFAQKHLLTTSEVPVGLVKEFVGYINFAIKKL
ncbi:hypothetical protein KKH43_02755 [Patescibacteria group bacterium]|nr:hypothetical protein [Patescibacteria group bacterium]